MLLDNLFSSVLSSSTELAISVSNYILCILVSLGLGVFIAYMYTIKSKYTKSFVLTLSTLPAVVCVVILMVNGSVGVGVAVAGAFSLVRFRSVPGTAKEIGAIFLSMGAGLAMGIGYIGFAILFVVIVSLANLALTFSSFGETKRTERTLTVTIPEDLDYTNIFEDLFEKFTNSYNIEKVKTTNMGSLFKITYSIDFKKDANEKAFIDELRCRNGNLEIVIMQHADHGTEL